jgi:amphi-Trp domain-containing protein
MSSKSRFTYSATVDRAEVAAYLNRIAEGISAGSISMAAEKQLINLAPAGEFKLSIEADSNRDRSRGSLVLDLSWKAAADHCRGALEILPELREAADASEVELETAAAEA